MLEKRKGVNDLKGVREKYDRYRHEARVAKENEEKLRQQLQEKDNDDFETQQLKDEREELGLAVDKAIKKAEHAHKIQTELQQ